MILERVEKDELVKAIYESSNIVASTYNKNNKNLNVTFKNGGSYTYQDVSASDYMRFETAESQGKILNTEIKKYSFLKHDNVDTSEVINKIKELKVNEIAAFEVGIVKAMKDLIDSHETTGGLPTPMVDRLNSMFSVYNEMTKTPETA